MLVLDANVLLTVSSARRGFDLLGNEELVGPPLLWSEARSALHVSLWRGVISRDLAERTRSLVESGRVRERRHRRLGSESWAIADELGWAKTYDAEYLALARLLGATLVTLDRRLHKAAASLAIEVLIPT